MENIEGEHPPIVEVENLETAVQEAAARAESGDVVIMSPASASFDRFKNFMERGKLFKALVKSCKVNKINACIISQSVLYYI